MPKDGTQTATEPNEFYDTLSPTEQEVYDLIGSHGFRADKTDDGEWIGLSINGDETVGPFDSLSDLAYVCARKTTSDEDEKDAKPDDEADGFELTNDPPKTHKVKQALLPGTENAVLQDLRNAILGYRATTMEILELQSQQKDEKKLVVALMHKFEDELQTDKETGFKFYQVETVRAVLEKVEKEELKTEKVEN
jgi:hypothetical protein